LEQLSERSGVEVGTISAIEQRDSERSSKFLQIAPAFGLTVEQLADLTTDHDVSDLQPLDAPVVADVPKFLLREDLPDYLDPWMQSATAKLREIHPDHRAETMNFLDWQVRRKPQPQNGSHLPMAA
jgi:transcriptional regulator with XRE-family HTH domain